VAVWKLRFGAVEEVGDALHVDLAAVEKGRFRPAQTCGTGSSGRHDEKLRLAKEKYKSNYGLFCSEEILFLSILRCREELKLKGIELEVLRWYHLSRKSDDGQLTGNKIYSKRTKVGTYLLRMEKEI
jgi:hypothetical protein